MSMSMSKKSQVLQPHLKYTISTCSYHLGWCRYRVFPPPRKVLCTVLLQKENDELNFEFPLFTRKQLNKWRPPFGYDLNRYLGKDKSQLKLQMSLGMRLYVPANLLLISECQQITAPCPFQTKKKLFWLSFLRGLMSGGTGSGFHSVGENAPGFLEPVNSVSPLLGP